MAPTTTERPALPKALRRDSLLTFGLLGASALLWMVGLPASLLVLVTGPAIIAFAISALVNAKGVETAGAIRAWLAISIGMGVMVSLGGLGLFIMRGPTQELERCLDRAITEAAKRECEAQYQQAYDDLLERYGRVTTP